MFEYTDRIRSIRMATLQGLHARRELGEVGSPVTPEDADVLRALLDEAWQLAECLHDMALDLTTSGSHRAAWELLGVASGIQTAFSHSSEGREFIAAHDRG